ncbi:MAG: copper-binding protein [Stutzerimonas sp.]|uniref:copper-binding protein n=1 Tax=Stutzerimonas sp. TaxID=2901166 RepID=UPI003D14BF3D
MKNLAHFALATVLLLPTAQAAETATTPAVNQQPTVQTASATGTVQKLMPEKNRIVIAHGPVPALGWPAMTMGFKATPAQIASLAPGDRIAFEFRSTGMRSTILRIEKR